MEGPLMPLLIHFKELTLGRRLGGGGFGTVFEATHHGETVAVKVLNLLDSAHVADFRKEAETMIRLHHPRVVQLYCVCLENPFVLVMELMPGGSLTDLLHSQEQLSWDERIRIGTDIASGLAYLHRQGIVHCYLKSLNVLLDKERRAKLTDFGMSRIKNSNSTYGTAVITSLAWTAPEIVLEEGDAHNSKAAVKISNQQPSSCDSPKAGVSQLAKIPLSL